VPGKKVKKLALEQAQSLVRLGGYELVRKHFYSPLPDVETLPDQLWAEPRPMAGVDLAMDRAESYLCESLKPFLEEYRPPLHGDGPSGFFLQNGSYGPVDAEILYAILRHEQPSRVVEFGSGASSYVIEDAQMLTASAAFDHIIYDPYPLTAKALGPLPNATIYPQGVEGGDPAAIAESLTGGDVLFVDTTHTVRTGGDVDWVVCTLLPILPVGVLVHFHDIFLPHEYPRRWVVNERRAWAEQYLLQAFLSFNSDFEVLFPTHAMARATPELITRMIPSFGPGVQPGSFWIRRVASTQ
jgi:hypothetical protein